MNNRRLVLISLSVIVLIITIIALVTRGPSPSEQNTAPSGNSSASEDTPAATASAFIGFDNLINNGITVNQIDALQKAFQGYPPFSNPGTVIDASGGAIIPVPPSQSDPLYRPSMQTTVVVNHKTTYKITFYFWETSKIQLLIYDSTGQTKLFESGVVTGS